jgi:YHS domain-containing protein
VGKAVEGHFQDGINVYFCYQQRNIVITDNPISYLTEECLLLPQK